MFVLRTKRYIVVNRAMWCHALENMLVDSIGELWEHLYLIDGREPVVIETLGM